jgi:hypothetical protein
VFLVEACRDQVALMLAKTRETYQPWLVSREATRCTAD